MVSGEGVEGSVGDGKRRRERRAWRGGRMSKIWGGGRAGLVVAVEEGGIVAMGILARDSVVVGRGSC